MTGVRDGDGAASSPLCCHCSAPREISARRRDAAPQAINVEPPASADRGASRCRVVRASQRRRASDLAGCDFVRTTELLLEKLDAMILAAKAAVRGDAGRPTTGFYTSLSVGHFRTTLLDYVKDFRTLRLAPWSIRGPGPSVLSRVMPSTSQSSLANDRDRAGCEQRGCVRLCARRAAVADAGVPRLVLTQSDSSALDVPRCCADHRGGRHLGSWDAAERSLNKLSRPSKYPHVASGAGLGRLANGSKVLRGVPNSHHLDRCMRRSLPLNVPHGTTALHARGMVAALEMNGSAQPKEVNETSTGVLFSLVVIT